jgi:hypothetical protein
MFICNLTQPILINLFFTYLGLAVLVFIFEELLKNVIFIITLLSKIWEGLVSAIFCTITEYEGNVCIKYVLQSILVDVHVRFADKLELQQCDAFQGLMFLFYQTRQTF